MIGSAAAPAASARVASRATTSAAAVVRRKSRRESDEAGCMFSSDANLRRNGKRIPRGRSVLGCAEEFEIFARIGGSRIQLEHRFKLPDGVGGPARVGEHHA